jgi:hypothetical protein
MAEIKVADRVGVTAVNSSARSRGRTYALWIVQGLLAALFLFAGGTKLVLPIADLTQQVAMPGCRFIGVAEVLGGLGLILPGMLRIQPGLMGVSAAGLIVIMVGAVIVSVMTGPPVLALIPLTVGVLLVFVARARWPETARA